MASHVAVRKELAVLLVIVVVVSIVVQLSAVSELLDWSAIFAAILAMVLGSLAGFAEIISRYRDEPLRATTSSAGVAYLAANGVISLAAFALVRKYGPKLIPNLTTDPLMLAFVAGFGAMFIFRSRFFVIRSQDGKEYPVGPEVLITSLLTIVDRKIDRKRAAERQKLVYELTHPIQDAERFELAADFLEISLASFQRLTDEERAQYVNRAKALRELKPEEMPAPLKAMALGFMFFDLAGEDNLQQIFGSMTNYIDAHLGKQPAEAPVVQPPAPAPQPPPQPPTLPIAAPLTPNQPSAGNA